MTTARDDQPVDHDGGAEGTDETLLHAHDRERVRERRQQGRRGAAMALVGAGVVVAVVAGVVWAAGQPREVPTLVAETAWSSAPATATATPTDTPTPTSTVTATPSATEAAPPGPTTTTAANLALAGDISSASSVTVLVNKLTPLNPVDYAPDDLVDLVSIGVPSMNAHALRAAAADAAKAMYQQALAEGIRLDFTSGYRSSETQSALYEGYVASLGQEGADATSARPGYSEHQTGLAIDISSPDAGCPLEACFADTHEGQWLADRAWEFGFVLRYPKGETAITGYEFEPWHFRYVGTAVAAAMHEQGVATYEQFLGTPAAPDYAA